MGQWLSTFGHVQFQRLGLGVQYWATFVRRGDRLLLAEPGSLGSANDSPPLLQSGCSYRLPTISMERIAATEAHPTSTSTEPNSLHHKGFSRRTQKNPVRQTGCEPRSPQTSH